MTPYHHHEHSFYTTLTNHNRDFGKNPDRTYHHQKGSHLSQ